jgi:hypothetical protein
MKKKQAFVFLFLLLSALIFGQNKGRITNEKHKETFKFKFINNLIILPIKVNGTVLNFIIDSGSKSTLLLDASLIDTLQLQNKKRFMIKGLGENSDIEAIKSTNNLLQLKSISLNATNLYIPIDMEVAFSATFGMAIHGMIGYDLLNNFIVKINYTKQKITFYDPKYYPKIKCRRCEKLPISLKHKKPYINIALQTNEHIIPINMLLDTGGGDSFWLFENAKRNINIPEKKLADYLGRGLNGDIYGKRAKVKQISMAKYSFSKPIVSFPDSTAINLKKHLRNDRDGSIGARILKRFNIILDYPNKQFYFKKNRYFKAPFYYNMSGISTIYNGERIVVDAVEKISNDLSDDLDQGAENVFSVQIEKVIRFKRVNNYIINHIRKNSPAEKIGLQEEDIILFVNDKDVYNYKIEELNHIFFSQKEQKIKLRIMRKGELMNFTLILKDEL